MAKNVYRTFVREKKNEEELEELEKSLVTPPEEDELVEEPTTPEEKTFKKRYSDLRSYAQKKENELTERIKTLEEQIRATTKKEIQYPKTEQEVEEWMTKYPDLAGVFKTIVMKEVQKDREEIDRQFSTIAEERQRLAMQKAYDELLKVHPDFEEIKISDEFQAWIEDQPKYIWGSLYENSTDAKAAIRTIDLYKFDTGKTTKGKKNDDTRETARSVRTPPTASPDDLNRPKFTQSMLKKMSQRDFEKYEDEIMESMQHPEFYDVDGAAR